MKKLFPAHGLFLLLGFILSAGSSAQTLNTCIQPDVKYQRIDHFTASDAWSGNFVGQYWDDEQKEQIARWLFSSDYDATGNPEGIGLSLWRVNLGGGTLEQDEADIQPYQRRAESFLTKDGQDYDWSKCIGQQYFMQKAADYGCSDFLLFSNTPPVQYTKNGKGYSDDYTANLKPDCYTAFADYMTTVAGHFITEKGWNVRYISPVNEPQINWINNRQEGTPWLNSEICRIVTALDESLMRKGLQDVQIMTGEASSLQMLTGKEQWIADNFPADDTPWEQIDVFFNPDSPYYIGQLKHQPPLIGGHSYSSHQNNRQLREVREKVKQACAERGIDFIQTEWCMLPNLKDPIDGFEAGWIRGNYGGMDVALQLARLVYADLVYANSLGWGYWKAMEVQGNHALIALYPESGNLEGGGNVRTNKLLWALGNYSFFIRPGYTRIGLTHADDPDRLAASAYISPDESQLVAVYVNSSFEPIPVSVELPDSYQKRVGYAGVYRTTEQMDLAEIPGLIPTNKTAELTMPGRSVTTVVYEFIR